MPRNPELTYTHKGLLYGPGQAQDVAALDALAPLKADRVGDPNAGRTPAATQTQMPPAPPGGSAPIVDALPEDFPHRGELAAAGLTTARAVQEQTDAALVALEGIGPAGVKKIRAAAAQIVKAEGK